MSFEFQFACISNTDAGGIVFYGNYLKFLNVLVLISYEVLVEQSVTIENNLIL